MSSIRSLDFRSMRFSSTWSLMLQSGIHFMTSWRDLYQQMRARAAASRGASSDPQTTDTWPKTTVADANKLVLVFDQAIFDHLTEKESAELLDQWVAACERLILEPEDHPGLYGDNRALWSALAAAAGELDRARAPLPVPALVADAVAQ